MRDYFASSASTTSTRRLVYNTKRTDTFGLTNATASSIIFKDGLLGSKRARVSNDPERSLDDSTVTKRGEFQAIYQAVGCETGGTKVTRWVAKMELLSAT